MRIGFGVWGIKTYARSEGIAADFCVFCRRVVKVRVGRLASRRHFYFFPYGPKRERERVCMCWECSGIWPERTDLLQGIVPEKASPTLETLIAETHPSLRRSMANAGEETIREGWDERIQRITCLLVCAEFGAKLRICLTNSQNIYLLFFGGLIAIGQAIGAYLFWRGELSPARIIEFLLLTPLLFACSLVYYPSTSIVRLVLYHPLLEPLAAMNASREELAAALAAAVKESRERNRAAGVRFEVPILPRVDVDELMNRIDEKKDEAIRANCK